MRRTHILHVLVLILLVHGFTFAAIGQDQANDANNSTPPTSPSARQIRSVPVRPPINPSNPVRRDPSNMPSDAATISPLPNTHISTVYRENDFVLLKPGRLLNSLTGSLAGPLPPSLCRIGKINRSINADSYFVLGSESGWATATDLYTPTEASESIAELGTPPQGDTSRFHDLGLLLMVAGEYRQALVNLDESVRLDPHSATYLLSRGLTYLKAAEELAPCPNSNIEKSRWGWDLPAHHYFERALSDMTDVIRLNPNICSAYFIRARASKRLRYFARAISDYDRILQFEPGNNTARDERAEILSGTAPEIDRPAIQKALPRTSMLSLELELPADPFAKIKSTAAPHNVSSGASEKPATLGQLLEQAAIEEAKLRIQQARAAQAEYEARTMDTKARIERALLDITRSQRERLAPPAPASTPKPPATEHNAVEEQNQKNAQGKDGPH